MDYMSVNPPEETCHSQVDDIEEVFNMWLKSGQQFGISIDDFRNILEEGRIMKVEDENSSLHGKDISSQDMERCFIMSISVKVDDLDWVSILITF